MAVDLTSSVYGMIVLTSASLAVVSYVTNIQSSRFNALKDKIKNKYDNNVNLHNHISKTHRELFVTQDELLSQKLNLHSWIQQTLFAILTACCLIQLLIIIKYVYPNLQTEVLNCIINYSCLLVQTILFCVISFQSVILAINRPKKIQQYEKEITNHLNIVNEIEIAINCNDPECNHSKQDDN